MAYLYSKDYFINKDDTKAESYLVLDEGKEIDIEEIWRGREKKIIQSIEKPYTEEEMKAKEDSMTL